VHEVFQQTASCSVWITSQGLHLAVQDECRKLAKSDEPASNALIKAYQTWRGREQVSYESGCAAGGCPFRFMKDDGDKKVAESALRRDGEGAAADRARALSIVQRCVARYEYDGEDGHLSFAVGDVIDVHVIDTQGFKGWWTGSLKGATGFFPSSHVEALQRRGVLATKVFETPGILGRIIEFATSTQWGGVQLEFLTTQTHPRAGSTAVWCESKYVSTSTMARRCAFLEHECRALSLLQQIGRGSFGLADCHWQRHEMADWQRIVRMDRCRWWAAEELSSAGDLTSISLCRALQDLTLGDCGGAVTDAAIDAISKR